MIEVRNLTKAYGGRVAVNAVSFSVAEGEIVGFLGPNGAGKTTTIRVLTGFHPATSGTASIAGFDVFSQSLQVRSVVGYLPESNPLYPEMRVREYLNFRGRLRRMDRAQRNAAIERLAQRCWIRDVINRPIGQLSKGFRQRVGLADALLHNPKVLILDEPTVGLDPTQIRETRSLIRDLAAEHTVMLSSHILPEVEATCKRIIIIHKGSIVAAGSPAELRERIRGGGRVIAELRAPREQAAELIGKMPGASDVTCEAHDGWTRVTVTGQSDLREPLGRLAAERGWALRELRREGGSLEEFFVQIVAGG